MTEQAEIVVVGMGIAGEGVAGPLAEKGLDVVGIEKNLVGGECPYWGCIPSKMMIRAADLIAEARRIPGVAGSATVTPDYAPVAQRIREQATDNWNDQVAVDRFTGKGGRFVRGEARLAGPRSVTVDGTTYEASKALVLAAGTDAAVPPIPGLSEVDFWTNREAIEAKELPATLIVLGAGAIGLELSQAFGRFGVDVTVVEALDRLLPAEEPEAGAVLAEVFTAEGIATHVGVRATKVAADGDGVSVVLDDGTSLSAERLLVATGRRALIAELGLDAAGLDPDQRFISVDENMKVLGADGSPIEGMWAVGDVTGDGLFTHVAAYQAPIAAADILGEDHRPADYSALPRVTFTDPEVGSVGLSEVAARAQGIDVSTSTIQVPGSARGWLHATGNEGVIKLVADRRRGVLVGALSAGPAGGEVLGMLTLAVHAQVPLDRLRSMIYAYPTFHRGVEDALGDL